MIVIIDYGMGNPGSILNMIRKVGGDAVISSDKTVIENASKLILPGVGAYDNAMNKLTELDLKDVIINTVKNDKVIFLGICLGMQLLMDRSEEGDLPGLGLVEGEVKKFRFDQGVNLKVPHMGWNIVHYKNDNFLFEGLNEEQRFYFVHSYYVECKNDENILTIAEYGFKFTCGIQKRNVYGVQFHPEKSHKFGMNFFKNFINL